MLRHGSLFSGIGGFDLAAEWCGWENVFHCEWNEFGQKVLKHYWPEADSFGDITKTDFTKYNGTIDVISGGFPCQPYSTAGKRKGKEDERHLWPEMLRAIREIAPRFVVGENVRGLVNWNGGLVFDEVQTDLEALGYQVAAFLIPAAGVNAPHGRDRIWFVASNTNDNGSHGSKNRQSLGKRNDCNKARENKTSEFAGLADKNDATNADSNGQHGGNGEHEKQSSQRGEYAQRNLEQMGGYAANAKSLRRENALEDGKLERGQSWERNKPPTWDSFPLESPICGGDDGFPRELDGITFSKWRAESIKAYGNAIVPQVAYQIFKTIDFLDQN